MAFATSAVRDGLRWSSRQGDPLGSTRRSHSKSRTSNKRCVKRARGVVFEEYDSPGLQTSEGIARVEGNYPSSGAIGERAAWFRDSEGNLLAVGQPIR